MRTIAVIDKHPIVRAGLAIFIKNNFNESDVFEFESFYHFESGSKTSTPDLLIIGNTVELPSNQCKIIRGLKSINQQLHVIIYEDNADPFKVTQYFKSGASGYVTKRSAMGELLKCLSDVQKGTNYISNDILEILIPKWQCAVNEPSLHEKTALTNREFEVANHLIQGDTITEISAKLHREPATISGIKKTLFTKLKINNVMDLKYSLQNQ